VENIFGPVRFRLIQVLLYIKEAIPLTDHGDLKSCELFGIPQCIDNRFTYGGEVASLTHRPRSTLHKLFSVSGTHFYLKFSKLKD
jgi:hypothetical protein